MTRELRAMIVLAFVAALGLASAAPAPAAAQAEGRRDRLYLTELAITLEGARRLMLWVETHINDPEVARFATPLAERYVQVAEHLTPPARLAVAHPHLLLIVENAERAIEAASLGELAVFRQRARTVREELAILDSVIKQLKLKLPEMLR